MQAPQSLRLSLILFFHISSYLIVRNRLELNRSLRPTILYILRICSLVPFLSAIALAKDNSSVVTSIFWLLKMAALEYGKYAFVTGGGSGMTAESYHQSNRVNADCEERY